MNEVAVKYVFYVAGIINLLGVPMFTKLYTNLYIGELYPGVFSIYALIVIQYMGLLYIIAGTRWAQQREVALFCAGLKSFYALTWVYWLFNNSLVEVFQKDVLTGIFYAIYGPNDTFFALVWFYAALFVYPKSPKQPAKVK